MPDLNRVILIGRLTADPELKQTPSGVSCCRFKVAISRSYKDSSGNYPADFIDCQAWRQKAEFVSKYFSKGKCIIVEGNLQNNDYTDKDGVKHYGMIVLADNVSFGESKGGSGTGTQQTSQTAPQTTTTPAPATAELGDLGDFEEILSDGELPF